VPSHHSITYLCPVTRDRLFAAGSGLAVLVGALTMLVALVAVPGPWLAGYVSEAGTAGRPFAVAYRCGLILLAVGVGLLAAAFRRIPAIVALLGLAAVLAATSGAVRCSSGCPLPPFEPTTVADVVHAAASIVGMVTLAAAMVAVAVARALRPATRRLACCAAALTVPLGGFLGLTMLFVGRSGLGASLERVLLVLAVSWLIGTALVTNLPSTIAAPRSMGSSPGLPATSAVGRLSADSADDGE
jgi:hypothetical protein